MHFESFDLKLECFIRMFCIAQKDIYSFLEIMTSDKCLKKENIYRSNNNQSFISTLKKKVNKK